MNPSALSDEMLLSSLRAACLAARRTEAQVIAFLVEVEDRRLDLRSACSSLWDFCRKRLAMSESEAQRRIVAARLVRKIPALFRALEGGRLTLSTLVRLQKIVTVENAEELVAATSGLTREDVEMFVAKRAPRPDVPATLRKLPDARAAAPVLLPATVPSTGELLSAQLATPAPPSPPLAGLRPAAAAAAAAPLPRLEPLAEARYRLQLTASAQLRDKLERARALMRHRHPSGDLAAIVEAAVDLLVQKLEKERLGSVRAARPVMPRAPSAVPVAAVAPAAAVAPVAPGNSPGGSAPAPASRDIPRAVRRAVFARDGERCTFVDESGRRCDADTLLELDHIDPHARGGTSDVANLRVACRAHNRLHAERSFGREHMARQRDLRRGKSQDA